MFGYVILISIKFCELFLWLRIINALRSNISHSKEVWKLVQLLRFVSWTFSSVSGYLMKHSSSCLIYYFSNSWLINEQKTKEITAVKEVWICDPNYHKIQWTFAFILSKNYQCFDKLWEASTLVEEKTHLHLLFWTRFSVFGYLMKHSSSCMIYTSTAERLSWRIWCLLIP